MGAQLEGRAGADGDAFEEQGAELILQVGDELGALLGVEGVDLVEHAEDLAAVGAQALEGAALGGRAAAGGGEVQMMASASSTNSRVT